MIAARLWGSSTMRRQPSDALQVRGRSRLHDPVELWSWGAFNVSRPMTIGRSRSFARSRKFEAIRSRSKLPRSATCHSSSGSLKNAYSHVLDWWSRGLWSTRSPPLWSDRTPAKSPRHLQKNKIVWEHSPTRIKWRDKMRLNRGVASPIHYPYSSSISRTRGAPHGRPRGAMCRVATCHIAAPPVCHLATRGPPVALPRGLSASSHPLGGPARHVSARQLSRSPRQRLQVRNHFFVILNRKNS